MIKIMYINWLFFIKECGYNLDTQPWKVKKMIKNKKNRVDLLPWQGTS